MFQPSPEARRRTIGAAWILLAAAPFALGVFACSSRHALAPDPELIDVDAGETVREAPAANGGNGAAPDAGATAGSVSPTPDSGAGGAMAPAAGSAAAVAGGAAAVAGSRALAAGGAGGAGASSEPALDCSRVGLQTWVDGYFTALAAHDPAQLPRASNLRVTENGREVALDEGLWKSAGPLQFQRNTLDVERCSTFTEALLEVGGTLAIAGVRLKVENQQLTESESYVVTAGSPFSPDSLRDSAVEAAEWDQESSSGERQRRDQLEAIADAYFDSLASPSVQPAFGMPCGQRMNGAQITTGTCASLFVPLPIIPGLPQINASPTHRRYPVTDLERGVVVGLGVVAEGVLSFNVLKTIDGKIRFVDSVAGPMATEPGWDVP